ncbi:MAG: universal stress protein [Chloroflexota bacterium]|nr:MAG: universal stress protein [Chloroflexota bacterium]
MESYSSAISDFRRARGRAALQSIVAKLTGGQSELLSYEDVRRKVRAGGVVSRGIREVPLDAIVGSVGRYQDFTRTFLPKHDSDEDRWVRVSIAATGMTGLPPVELYQIGEVYFVFDGHHRISVARQQSQTDIQAYVTEVRSKVPLTVDTSPDDLIVKAEQVKFLAHSGLDASYPDADLSVTCPGRYQELFEHIAVHRHYMGLEQLREISFEEAAAHWYEHVYSPVVRSINDQGILYDFPGRTETDLYLWIGKHRADLEDLLGWDIPYSTAAADLADSEVRARKSILSRLGQRVLEVMTPEELEAAPKAGQWRRERQAEGERLFTDILVALSGQESSWLALEQAIPFAEREGGRLKGLLVVADESEQESDEAHAVRDHFYWRCGEVGLEGRFVTDVGPVARTLCQRARWSDLLVVNLAHRPGESPRSRWASGFRTIMQRCSRPVLAVPDETSDLNRLLLAYDGSPQAQEALYVATYLSGQWRSELVVMTMTDGDVDERTQALARTYLEERTISATYVMETGTGARAILSRAEELNCDGLILGGSGRNPVVGVVTGSKVDEILATTTLPVLVCR